MNRVVTEMDEVGYVAKNGDHYPATVARAHEDGTVNLYVFRNVSETEPYGVVGGASYDPDKKPGTWHWKD